MIFLWRRFLLKVIWTLLLTLSVEGKENLSIDIIQSLIDKAEMGSQVNVPAGEYFGALKINKSVNLVANGKVTINGNHVGTVITIQADDVQLRGLRVVGSGENHTESDAGILISGKRPRIIENTIEDCFFGIKVKDVSEGIFSQNIIRSYVGKSVVERGDGFFVWNSTGNKFIENQLESVRDFSINNSYGNILESNTVSDSRTGIFLVFAERTQIRKNRLQRNSTGIAALYSPRILVEGNIISHNLEGNGSCISTKDSMGVRVIDNQFIHCAVGYLSDAPLGEDLIQVEGNLFAHNYLGIRIYGQKGSHNFKRNVFVENLVTMFLPLDGPYSMIKWSQNYWDEYRGFGGQPFQDIIYSDRIWMEIPQAKFFSNSPFFELIDFLERLAPFSSPSVQAEDLEPQSNESEVYLRYKDILKH